MGLYDYVIAPSTNCSCCGNEVNGWQTKDTPFPCMDEVDRDATDEHGKYLINEYYSFCNYCHEGKCDNKKHTSNNYYSFIVFKRVQFDWVEIRQ